MAQTALIISKPGEPLKKITRSVPAPGPQEVLIKNHAIGLNPHDRKIRDFGAIVHLDKFPYITGNDISGVVETVGEGVTNANVGDRVFTQAASTSLDTSGLQEYTITSSALLAKIPGSMTFEEAATLPICVPSVATTLFHSTGLGLPLFDNIAEFDYPSKTILILGGGSNCGKAAIQLSRLVGFGTILTVASKSPEKEAKLKQLGATVVVDRHSPSLQEDVREAVGDDLVYAVETVSQGEKGHTLGVSALSNNARGTLVTITHGTVDESAIGEKRAGYEKRFTVGSSHVYPEFGEKVWSELPKWIQSGNIVPFSFRTIRGLDAAAVDAAIDEYRSGEEVVKAVVVPHEQAS
ncbi:Alcohol dehydrogenase superfamily, zinc-type [Akanthomyces lecanii RCEF 1005]|uniref:Alcohol dehydrogenase superfamily, zinc-type n=1 Tax=Akanthomyces lecanii RCEF 1005 TaxID=1081108 RepID=A0A162MVB9_CORDF|nr:Alcohol dehydrogenase superfamily, zinc-type [Akanthomyces lecanii RCEF 1005]